MGDSYEVFLDDLVQAIAVNATEDPEEAANIVEITIQSKDKLERHYKVKLTDWIQEFRGTVNDSEIRSAFRKGVPDRKIVTFGTSFLEQRMQIVAPFFINGNKLGFKERFDQMLTEGDNSTGDKQHDYMRLYAEVLFILMGNIAAAKQSSTDDLDEEGFFDAPLEASAKKTVAKDGAKVDEVKKTGGLESDRRLRQPILETKNDLKDVGKGRDTSRSRGSALVPKESIREASGSKLQGKLFSSYGDEGDRGDEASGEDDFSISGQSAVSTERSDSEDELISSLKLHNSGAKKSTKDHYNNSKAKQAKKAGRLMQAQRNNFDKDARPLSIAALTRMVQSPEGLTMFALNGGQYKVKLSNAQKSSGIKRLLYTLAVPPDGKRSVEECGERYNALHIFPRSQAQLEAFLSEQQSFLHAAVAAKGKSISSENLLDAHNMTVEITEFRRKLMRLCETTLTPYPRQHITIYAVILRFVIITWNTALAHNDITLLTSNFETRWERDYKSLVFRGDDGETVQEIAEALAFLQYICSTQACSAIGMAPEHCFFCNIGVYCSVSTKDTTHGKDKGFEEGYKAWRAKLKSGEDMTRETYKRSLPAGGAKASAPARARQQVLTVSSTYSALSRDQSVIAAPRAEFYGRA